MLIEDAPVGGVDIFDVFEVAALDGGSEVKAESSVVDEGGIGVEWWDSDSECEWWLLGLYEDWKECRDLRNATGSIKGSFGTGCNKNAIRTCMMR